MGYRDYREKSLRERANEFVIGFGFVGIILLWLFGILISFALPIVVIWALIKLVFHFTA